jgi:hypothetical protein
VEKKRKKKPIKKVKSAKSSEKDLLSEHGMTVEQQHGAEMRASAVPPSDFEGEYQGPGRYTSLGAQFLQRILWESRMRNATGIPKLENEEENQ